MDRFICHIFNIARVCVRERALWVVVVGEYFQCPTGAQSDSFI